MRSVLKRVILDFHQSQLPDFRRRDLKVPLGLDKIITIIGPRRAGKTYYLYQIMSDLMKQSLAERHQILYLNFEDERLDLEGDNDVIFEAYRELYPHQDLSQVFLFFDEIQEIPNWEKFIRRVTDTISRNIFLTGSNAKMLSREIATSLRGRSLNFEILPLSFREYLAFQDIPSDDLISSRNRAKVNNAFEQYCLWGGFPELIKFDDGIKARVLQEYFNVMLYRDLVERYEIRDVSILKYLLKRLIGSYTKEFSINKLYNDLKSRGFAIGKDTLYQMIDEIFSIYMLAYVEKYDPAVIKREMSNKRVYLFDNGFAAATQYSFSEDRGKRLENIVYRHLREKTEAIFFIRNKWECDFVILWDGRTPDLVQVTDQLHEQNFQREIKGLESAKHSLGAGKCLLLVDSVQKGLEIPDWVAVQSIQEWLLEQT